MNCENILAYGLTAIGAVSNKTPLERSDEFAEDLGYA